MDAANAAPLLIMLMIVPLIALRMIRNARGRRLRPRLLWIRPAIIAIVLAATLAAEPMLGPLGYAVLAVALAVGAGVGLYLDRHHHLTIDDDGAITSRMAPIGMILFIVLYLGRFAVREWIVLRADNPAELIHNARYLLYSDAALMFVLGMLVAQSWLSWRRVKHLQAGHAARRAGDPAPSE